MKIIGIIPARSGSKGVPNKNIRKLSGSPLIEYSIKAAIKSKLANIVVTSDSAEIGKIAHDHNLEFIKRPMELSGDSTPMLPVVQHVLRKVEDSGEHYDAAMILQPTSPFRTTMDINSVIEIFQLKSPDSVVSLCKVEDAHPGRMYKIEDGSIKPCIPELVSKNRQDLPVLYLRNGAIYCTKRDVIFAGSIYGGNIAHYVMPKERSINIDDMLDWRLAELMMQESNLL